jgi:hypothetical protein
MSAEPSAVSVESIEVDLVVEVEVVVVVEVRLGVDAAVLGIPFLDFRGVDVVEILSVFFIVQIGTNPDAIEPSVSIPLSNQ